jgi:hypothetical protein
MMLVVTAPLSPIGLIAFAYLSIIFSVLSQRLNAVAKKAEHHRWFSVATVLIILAAMSQAVRSTAHLAPDRAFPFLLSPWFALATFHVPLALGATIDLLLVWYYWGWIVKETGE